MNVDFHIEEKQLLFKKALKRNVIGRKRTNLQTCRNIGKRISGPIPDLVFKFSNSLKTSMRLISQFLIYVI